MTRVAQRGGGSGRAVALALHLCIAVAAGEGRIFGQAAAEFEPAEALAEGGGSAEQEPENSPVARDIVDPELVPVTRDVRPGKLTFEGLEVLDEAAARDLIRLQIRTLEERGVTLARADDAAFFFEEELRREGYEEARVDWEITGQNVVVLKVQEGRPVLFGEVSVTGNEHLSDEAIRELLTHATRKRLGYRIDSPDIPYVATDVRTGVNEVKQIYALLGFADAEVVLDEGTFDPETRRHDLVLNVTEGRERRVGELFLPPPVQPEMEALFEELRTEFGGRPYTRVVIPNLTNRLELFAQEAGYFDATVEAERLESRAAREGELTQKPPNPVGGESSGEAGGGDKEEALLVDVKVEADWGERYTLGSVEVQGIERVREGVIERRMEPLIGRTYSPSAISKMVEKMIQTGSFEGFTYEPIPQPDHTILLKVDVREAQRHALGIYGGFGSYEGGILGFEYRRVNFLSRLNTFEAELEVNGRGLLGDVGFTNPWLFGSEWAWQLNFFSKTVSEEGYDIQDFGFRTGFRRFFGKDDQHRFTLFALPQFSKITESEIDERFLGPTSYLASRVGLAYSYDRRNDRVNPREGYVVDLVLSGASSATGSEVTFGRFSAKASYYLPIKQTTLRLGARVGIIAPDGELPIDLRYFTGGPRSVRSFPERELGPRSPNGFPLGGEFLSVFNVEYDIPIKGPLSIAPFVDAGNLLPSYEDASLDEMHYAAGLGLILNSPIGPLRLDYGHNLNRGANEPVGTWHVAFGFAF